MEKEGNYDLKLESDIINWIEHILGKKLPEGTLFEILKDGVVLCELVDKITGKVSKFPSRSRASFFQMENIAYFISSAKELGVPDYENFTTIDLFENKNIKQVILCLCSLSRNLASNGRSDIPVVGPRLTKGTPIKFTQKQLDDAKKVVSMQYGGNSCEAFPYH